MGHLYDQCAGNRVEEGVERLKESEDEEGYKMPFSRYDLGIARMNAHQLWPLAQHRKTMQVERGLGMEEDKGGQWMSEGTRN